MHRILILHGGVGVGLSRDAHVLEDALHRVCRARGTVCDVQVIGDLPEDADLSDADPETRRRFRSLEPFDFVFHLETAFYAPWLAEASRFREHLLVPNPEVLTAATVENAGRLGVETALCKTRWTEELVGRDRPLWRTVYTGWHSIDMFDDSVEKRWDRCVHVRGTSTMKQSQVVIDAWTAHPDLPPIVVTLIPRGYEDVPEEALDLPLPCEIELSDRFRTVLGALPYDELRRRMNGAGIHVCPSLAEGFGHYINEARSTGACVVTTDAPPMNELVDRSGGTLIPVDRTTSEGGTTCSHVTPEALAESVRELRRQSEGARREMGRLNRGRFLAGGERFVARLGAFLSERSAARPARRERPADLLAHLGLGPDDRVVNLHVDDLGMCQATLPAFAELWRRGAVTSASAMVPCPWFPEAARFCREHPAADVGVHVTLTSEWQSYRWSPLSTRDPASGLLDRAGYLPKSRQALHERAVPEAVEREIAAQLERAAAMGVEVTHLDSHMYAVAHPELMPRYVEIALAEGLVPLVWRPGGGARWAEEGRAWELLRKWELRGVPVPARLDVFRLGDLRDREERLASVRRLLESLPAGLTHLAVHPAVDTPELRAVARDWRSRVAEYETLKDPAFVECLDDLGIRRVSYRDLRDAMRQVFA